MIITVKHFEDKSNEKGVWYLITDENDKSHHLFGTKIPELLSKRPLLNEGHTVELVKVKNPDNAKFWDCVDVKSATVTEAVQKDQSSKYATNATRSNEIGQHVATKAIGELLAFGKEVPPDIEARFWCIIRELYDLPPVYYQKEPEATPEPPQQATEVQSKLGEVNAGSMKTLGDLMTACKTHYNMSPSTVRSLLGVKSNEDIKMSPAEAFMVIEKFQRSKK